MWESILVAAVVAVIGGLGWLTKRVIEGRSDRARIEEARSLASLHRELTESGATLATIDALKKSLLERRRREKDYEDEILEFMRQDFRTQLEMSMNSGHLLEMAEAKLNLVLAQYKENLDSERADLFDKSQKAWARFAEAEGKFAASLVSGGSMYPMVYASQKEEMTIQRAAALKAALEAERDL